MGIELPTPLQGGNASPENRGGMFDRGNNEASHPSYEAIVNNPNVDKNSSNFEARKEVMNGAGAIDNTGQPVQLAVNSTTSVHDSGTHQPTSVLDDVPVVAADEDLIEKVWVDAVKSVVTRTAGDPYARSTAIGQLQKDYLQKRYGKMVGDEQ